MRDMCPSERYVHVDKHVVPVRNGFELDLELH